MYIFIVMRGERNEGGSVKGAFTTGKKAKTFITRMYPDFVKHESEDTWVCGVDWAAILRMNVR
jgi:hypothetical protein